MCQKVSTFNQQYKYKPLSILIGIKYKEKTECQNFNDDKQMLVTSLG